MHRLSVIGPIWALLLLCAAAQDAARAGNARGPLSAHERALHLASRITFGPTPALIAEIEKLGTDAFIDQIFEWTQPDAALAAKLKILGAIDLPTQEIYAIYDRPEPAQESAAARQERVRRRDLPGRELPASIFWRAIESRAQAAEVLADFWRNHFNVDAEKDGVGYAALEYDRVVIRRHVFGTFADMLSASAHHPAMLYYLDNVVSRRPPSKTEIKRVGRETRQKTGSKERGAEAQKIAEQSGLNENYARELMELHTLGVDNGYTQKDVIAVAEALTGWTVDTADRRWTFRYDDDLHAEGDKFVLGRSITREKKRNGVEEGEAILDLLAAHPNTADFIAKKLCVHFVNDDPSPAIVEKASAEFKRTRGDLRAVVKAILKSEEFYDPANYRAKFRTPFEFMVAAIRAAGAEVNDPMVLVDQIAVMGQPIYHCVDPTGFRDTAESWRDPGVMTVRWRFALDLAANRMPGIIVPDEFFADLRGKPTAALIDGLSRRILPNGMRSQTIAALMRIAADHAKKEAAALADPKAEKPTVPIERRLLGVLLGSPEFQEQ